LSTPSYNKTVNVKTTGSTTYQELPAHTFSLNIPRTLLDDTDFTSTGWMSRVAGLKDYNLSGSVYDNPSSTAAIKVVRDAILNGTKLDVQYLSDGTKGFHGQVLVESIGHSGDVAGLETFDISLQSAGTALTTV